MVFDARVTCLPAPLSKTVLTRFGRPRERIKRGDDGHQIEENDEEGVDQHDTYYEEAEEEIKDCFPEGRRRGGNSYVRSRIPPVAGRRQRNGGMQMDMRGISSSHGHTRGGKHIDEKVTCFFFRRVLSRLHSLALRRPQERFRRETMVIRSTRTAKKNMTKMMLTTKTKSPKRRSRTNSLSVGDGCGDSFMNSRRTPAVGRWRRSGFDARVTCLPAPLSKTVLTRFGRPRERIKRGSMVTRSRRTVKKESIQHARDTYSEEAEEEINDRIPEGGDGVVIRT